MEIVGLTELSPCWRPLLQALAAHIPVQWTAGPRTAPAWLEGTGVAVVARRRRRRRSAPSAQRPPITKPSRLCAGRGQLLASGEAARRTSRSPPPRPADYDDHFLALRADANIDLHFVHGVRVTTTREGQAAAALADILVRGLSQSRLRRLAALCARNSAPFEALPEGWLRVLPTDAPLAQRQAWDRLLARLKPRTGRTARITPRALRAARRLARTGTRRRRGDRRRLLHGRALAIWRKALLAGPAGSIDATLETLKQDDGLEACVSVAWMPASALAASPRRFVRLIGLNSSRWPRGIAEDRLIPDHIIPTAELDPLPVSAADRRDFETILATTCGEVVLSRAAARQRRPPSGTQPAARAATATRPISAATPYRPMPSAKPTVSWPGRRSSHRAAGSRGHSLLARLARARRSRPMTASSAPIIRCSCAILARTQSASSLKRLLRNPLALSGSMRSAGACPKAVPSRWCSTPLGSRQSGPHGSRPRPARAGDRRRTRAGRREPDRGGGGRGRGKSPADWESERAVPPAVIWQRTLDDARLMASRALPLAMSTCPDARSYRRGAVRRGDEPKSDGRHPVGSATRQ